MHAHELQALIAKLESAELEDLAPFIDAAIAELQRQRRLLLSLADIVEEGLNK